MLLSTSGLLAFTLLLALLCLEVDETIEHLLLNRFNGMKNLLVLLELELIIIFFLIFEGIVLCDSMLESYPRRLVRCDCEDGTLLKVGGVSVLKSAAKRGSFFGGIFVAHACFGLPRLNVFLRLLYVVSYFVADLLELCDRSVSLFIRVTLFVIRDSGRGNIARVSLLLGVMTALSVLAKLTLFGNRFHLGHCFSKGGDNRSKMRVRLSEST